MKKAMEILIWQGNGFACMAMRKAGTDVIPASTQRPTIEECLAEAEKKLGANEITIAWKQVDRISSQKSFGGWIGTFEK